MKKQAKRMCHRLIQREDSEGNLYCPHPLHERTRAKQAKIDRAQHSKSKPISQEAARALLKACKCLLAEIVRLNDAKITAWRVIAKGEEAIALVERGE